MVHPLWLVFTFLAGSLFQTHALMLVNQAVTFNQPSVDYRFGQEIAFSIQISPVSAIKEMDILIRVPNAATRIESVPLSVNNQLSTDYSSESITYLLNLKNDDLPPFAHLIYSYHVTTRAGKTIQSPDYTFVYSDNRFEWKNLELQQFNLHWYGDNDDVRQNLIKISETGLTSALKHFPGQLSSHFDLYVYPNTQAMQQALKLPTSSRVIAHTLTQEGVILVTVTGSDSNTLFELERQVPHEIVHLIQFQSLGAAFSNLPAWLAEGSATLAEIYPNPDDENRLQQAVLSQSLRPMVDLCHTFPADDPQTRLAYAQSASFVTYLQGTYGTDGISRLVSAYQNGMDCENGFKSALGVSLNQAEETWKSETLHMSSSFLFL